MAFVLVAGDSGVDADTAAVVVGLGQFAASQDAVALQTDGLLHRQAQCRALHDNHRLGFVVWGRDSFARDAKESLYFKHTVYVI